MKNNIEYLIKLNNMEKRYKLRDLDNIFIDFLIQLLNFFDKEEDNYMSIKDRKKLYRLSFLLGEYRNGYEETYNFSNGNIEEWNKLKKKQYDEMFRLLKHLLPKLYI